MTARGEDVRGALGSVRVALGDRSYDVLIGGGLIDRSGALIADRLGPRRCAIVTDRTVAAHHLGRLEASLDAAKLRLGTIVLEPGEATKQFGPFDRLCQSLLDTGLERRDLVVALGGGVIGDIAGFAAAVLRRGTGFVQIPTTLLAQVDSSVGGKTAINTPQGKNLIGAFHQPSLVLADTDALATLPARQMRAGYAEVAKYGLLGDADFFAWLEANAASVLDRDRPALTRAIGRSVQMKADIVARDETESGDRMLLNLGHTFGHALEAWAGFSDRLLHGEAIAIGQVMAFRFSERTGQCAPGVADRVEAHFAKAGLPTRVADAFHGPKPAVDELMRLMDQDKKVAGGRLTLILARAIGDAFITRQAEREAVAAFVAEEIGRPGRPV